jgi:hypothetical protein
MEWLGIRPHHELEGAPLLTALYPFGVRARILCHVGREPREYPVSEENPFHAGNLLEGAI